MVQNDLNPEIPTIVNRQPTFPTGSPRQNPNLGGIAFNKPDGSSWYNSLQAYLTRNLGKNLQFQASYTYSKCIDYGSIAFGLEAGNSGQQAQSDPYNLARDKGVCDFDVRHNFVANTVYRLPFRGNRWAEGWQVTGILTARSGTPFSIQDGIDQANLNNPAGQPGERPDLTGQSSLPPGGRNVQSLVQPWCLYVAALRHAGRLAQKYSFRAQIRRLRHIRSKSYSNHRGHEPRIPSRDF
jgi:hypothetical protein